MITDNVRKSTLFLNRLDLSEKMAMFVSSLVCLNIWFQTEGQVLAKSLKFKIFAPKIMSFL